MKGVLSWLCVMVLVAAAYAAAAMKSGGDHDHEYNCENGGIFSDPADKCEGYHVCGFNMTTGEYEHLMYIPCKDGKLYDSDCHQCVSDYTCPH